MPVSHRILITAGPTHEPIDAVRFLANRSSGRLGIALAEESARRGHATTLLLGPTHLEPQTLSHLRVIRFRTTADLQNLLHEHWPQHDTLIMAAAVADYTPAKAEAGQTTLAVSLTLPAKIPRTDEGLTLHLQPTPDLLADLAKTSRPDQTVIGFALEPADRLLESARSKLTRKRLDAIVANPLETMDSETISAKLIRKGGDVVNAPPDISKRTFACWLLDRIAELRA